MRLHRPARLLTGWIAGLALLFAALAPALSPAFGAQRGASWVEVCTAQGSAWVKAETGGDQGDAQKAHTFEHCASCFLQAHGPALPPAALTAPLVQGADVLAPAFLAAPRTLHAWVGAQPRAPPALS